MVFLFCWCQENGIEVLNELLLMLHRVEVVDEFLIDRCKEMLVIWICNGFMSDVFCSFYCCWLGFQMQWRHCGLATKWMCVGGAASRNWKWVAVSLMAEKMQVTVNVLLTCEVGKNRGKKMEVLVMLWRARNEWLWVYKCMLGPRSAGMD